MKLWDKLVKLVGSAVEFAKDVLGINTASSSGIVSVPPSSADAPSASVQTTSSAAPKLSQNPLPLAQTSAPSAKFPAQERAKPIISIPEKTIWRRRS